MFRSLSFRMITIFICLTVLVVLITSIVFMFLFQKFAITDQQTTITKCAQEIAQIVSKDEASAYDYRKSTINDYNSFTESILDSKLWIVMTDGMFRRIGTSSKSPYHIKELTEKEASNIYRSFDGKTIYTTDFKESFGEDTMTVLVPIMSTVLDDTSIPQVIGTVLVHCPMTKINESFTTAQTFLIVAIVFAVFIAMAVAIALSMRFTKPLKQMCSAAAQIAEGNYSVRTHIYDRSELSELSMSLNHLAKTLSRTISALQSETEKLNNIIAVSYTHLDVYKRQPLHQMWK